MQKVSRIDIEPATEFKEDRCIFFKKSQKKLFPSKLKLPNTELMGNQHTFGDFVNASNREVL